MTGKIVQLNYKYSLDKKGDVLMPITGEMIISGFISKIVSDVVDIPENPIKKAIKDADKKRRDKNQSIETRIYQVTIDAIKEFTKREYKGQDVLYDAAESIIGGLKNSNNNIEAVRVGLKMLVSQVTSETCEEFLKTLCHVICIDKNDVLYKQITLIQGGKAFEAVNEGFDVSNRNDEKTHEKLDYVIEGIDNITEKISGAENDEIMHYKVSVKNRADEYAKKWDENAFLNNFNKEDEDAGTEIKLSEIYKEKCLPHYIWERNTKPSKRTLRNLLKDYIIDNQNRKMLLILGQPGIGKSTLITWIMANLVEKKDDIFVYQFANDLGSINWQGENVLNDIFRTIGLGYDDLENKTLIIDGFDEIYVSGERERILNKLNQELKRRNILKNFSLIITCRENYVNQLKLGDTEYITLQSWNEEQIKSFCEIYEEVIIRKNSESGVNKNSEIKISKIVEKKDIMGIPLILYMVLALNVDIERGSSIVDIYDQIFSLKKGGIYDRRYDVEHRINEPETKGHIHHISQRIAFWMFENNADEATIPQENFEEICENEMIESGENGEEIQSNTLIGNFFRLKHCEGKGTDELQFVHRSIYEYFVVIYFFESIHKLKSKEEVAGQLGELLKEGHLTVQMLEFIKCKFDSMGGFNFSNVTKEIFNIMLRHGMTFYTKEKYSNVIDRERRIFSNMLKIVRLWNLQLGEMDYGIITYLQLNRENKLNLKGIKFIKKNSDLKPPFPPSLDVTDLYGFSLRGVNLRGIYLYGVDLSDADLREVNLSGADLGEANLVKANLAKAYLCRINLRGANLRRANLRGTDLSGADLNDTNLKGAHLSNAVLKGAYLNDADLRGIELNGTYLGRADLSRANLSGTYLNGVNLCSADLSEANLNGAKLSKVNLCNADLSEVNLSEIDLNEVDLSGADLYRTILSEEQVNMLYGKCDLKKSRIVLSEGNRIVGYREYYTRKKND